MFCARQSTPNLIMTSALHSLAALKEALTEHIFLVFAAYSGVIPLTG
jgi:hypothetical protein